MNKYMIIVLEGLPASGKTTLANYLRDNLGFYKVNESLGYLGGVNLTDNQAIIFEETIEKYKLANQVKENLIIDRGYVSMLAWDYCAVKLNKIDNLSEKEGWVAAAFKEGRLFEPDVYIYLIISPELSLLRRPRKEDDRDIWTTRKGLKYCVNYYDNFFKTEKVRLRTIIIDASLSFKEIVYEVRQQLYL